MANLFVLLLRHPLQALLFTHSFLTQVILVLLRRLLLPHFPFYQSLRLQIQRAYLSSAAFTFPDLTHRLPVGNLPANRARKINHDVPAYLIPGTQTLSEFLERKTDRQKCVALYAHGGGYARGEAQMYVNYMDRWARFAAKAKLDLVFLSVEYPLSTTAGHPAQMDAFLAAYRYLLDSGVDSRNIVFMGDSAGGGLSVLTALELKRQSLPQPAACVLISPWMDMALYAYEGGNAAVETDYFVQANLTVPALVKLFIGEQSPTSSEVNPLYCTPAELEDLCPQLILVGGGEFAVYDSKKWAEVCKQAGIECKLNIEWGQLHIYAMGSKFVSSVVRHKTDSMIVDWIKAHIE